MASLRAEPLFQPSRPQGTSTAPRLTFNKDIAPIVFSRCSSCHRPGGGGPFSLLTYEDVSRRAKQIAAVTRSRYMPPWKPEAGYGEFAGTRRLSDQQVDTVERWIEQGAPRGDPQDLPASPVWPAKWQLGTPDLVVTMPAPYLLKSDGPDVFRTFVMSIPVATARYVRGLELDPGTARAVHHANLKIDRTPSSKRLDDDEPGPGFDGGGGRTALFPDGHFLGWTPGQLPRMLEGTAWRLEPGSDLVVELHMMPTGKPEPIQVSVGLFFTDEPPVRVPYMLRLGRQSIDIPAGARDYTITDSYVLPVDVDVLSVQPHAHNLARGVSGYATLPDGTTRWLIKIREWDFKWQDVYRYREPLALPSGTTLFMEYTYDNSAGNPRNPNNPPRRVTFGQTTSSEMGDLWLQVATRNAGDRAALDRDYAPKMLREDIAGAEKVLELSPADARLHTDLAFCYLDAGRLSEAVAQLAESVRLEPGSANAHYDLGTALLREKKLDEAGEHFARAVRLQPTLSEAHNNLGVVHFLKGRIEDAILSYTEALRLKADNAEAHYNLGRAFAAAQRRGEAIDQYEKALALQPDDAVTHSGLAGQLAGNGQLEQAIVHYRRALQLDPDLPTALVDLAWILATSERPGIRAPDEAVRLAERVAGLTSYQNATVLDTLAVAYYSAGRRDRAISIEQAALDLATADGPEELAARIRERLDFYRRQ